MNIRQLAKVIRTKNAGPYIITADLIFQDEAAYLRVKNSGVITIGHIANLYEIPAQEVLGIVFFDAANCIKINIRRPNGQASGDISDTDVLAMQQHGPLLKLEIPPGNFPVTDES